MWSKSRQTIRRYTTVRRNESNDLMLYSKQVESGTTPHKPTAVRYVLPSDQTTSPTPSASTSDPASGSLVHEKQQKCVVQLHSSDQSSSANDSSTANCNNTVIYL
ncbi:hypothetical protein M3Y97_00857400 [Aphelenchoides bicaudatus]|nr:hypothetical protein M3Y97_00857400 [Aphelenchoides bicaudatus]